MNRQDARKIAIIGLGQIGGSLVLALREAKHRCRITGIDVSRRRLKLLQGRLDEASTSWESAADADLAIVCLHYRQTVEFLQQAAGGLKLTMDVCSGKQRIMESAERLGLRFIGGHPMAGNERPGEKGWDPALFRGAPFFLCPSKGASIADLRLVMRIVRAIGATPVRVDPAEHDRSVALTSHLPAFLSAVVADQAADVPSRFKGPGFASITRLAATSPELLQTFLQSNGTNIRESARQLLRRLTLLLGD